MTTTITRDFSAKTRKALAARGITLVRPTWIAGPDGSFANGERAYFADDNGCGRILRFAEVLTAASRQE